MRIISDTTCHLSVEEAAKCQVLLVANQVTFGSESYRDYLELEETAFYDRLSREIARTSQPAVGEIMEAYEATSPEPTLHLTTGQGLSSAFDSAQGVKLSTQASHVTVFDSQCVAGPNRYLVQLAATLASAGASLNQVIERLQACLKEHQSYVIPVSFDFLKRSGRLTPLAATIAGFMNIIPVLAQSADRRRIEKFAVARTWKGAIDAVVKDLIQRGVSAHHRIYVAHAQNVEAMNHVVEAIHRQIADADIEVFKLAPAMVTHGGPGCVAIQYILKDLQASA
jgi:DegV family protein with EDD domain